MSTISLLERYGRAPSGAHVSCLVCRACGHETPVEATNICERCFGPLEVRYDYEEVARRISRESIAAGPPSIWRYRDLLPVDLDGDRADHARRGIHAADPRAQPGRRAGAAQPLSEERHAESDRLIQGSRRERRRNVGARARAHHHRLRQHRQSCQLGGGVRGPRRTACRRGRSQRSRACKDDRDVDLPADDHRGRGQLRRRQPSLHGARGLRRLGLLQPQPARLLQRGEQDADVRDRRAARVATARRDRRPGRVRMSVRQAPQGGRRADRARPG